MSRGPTDRCDWRIVERMVYARTLLLSLASLLACTAPPRSGADEARPVADEARPVADPDPFACAVDEACVAGPLVDPGDACCDTGVPLAIFSRAHLDRRAAWKREHCVDHACPGGPPPTPPLPCALQGRCVAGRCQNSCEAPALARPMPPT